MRILIILKLEYPGGTAAADRIQKLARGLQTAREEVFVIGCKKEIQAQKEKDWMTDEWGIPYTLVNLSPQPVWCPSEVIWAQINRNRHLLKKVKCTLIQQDFHAVLLYQGGWFLQKELLKLCQQNKTLALVDLTEWFSFSIHRILNPTFYDDLFSRFFSLPKMNGIIAISTLFENYAKSKGCKVIRIPALGEIKKPDLPDIRERVGFTLTYLGALPERDMPFTLMDGVRRSLKQGLDLNLVVVGRVNSTSTGRQVLDMVKNDPLLRSRVMFAGWVNDKEVRCRLAESDALVLLRRQDRENRACFPTRLPEYLLTRKPVIISEFGDMSLYFQHRKNAWLLPPGDRPKELAKALLHLVSQPDEAQAIGQAGFETALNEFSYVMHGRRLRKFINGLRNHESGVYAQCYASVCD